MNLFTINFVNSTFLVLFYTTFAYWISLRFQQLRLVNNVSWLGICTANVFLFTYLAARWINSGYFPLSNLYESLLFLVWCLLFVLLVIEKRTNIKVIGAVSVPIMLAIIGFATFILPPAMQEASPLVPALQSNWLMMHVSMMMFSYAMLLVGSILSILFIFLNYVKSSTFKPKSLMQNLDTWSYRVIGLGFPFLTIGIIAGAVWANEAWGSYWSWDPKETWALITWLVFAAYIHVRLIRGWDGLRAAMLGSFGFLVVWVCYLGVNFLGQGLHSYGFLS